MRASGLLSRRKTECKNFNLIQSEFKKYAGREVKFNVDHYSHLRGFSKGGDKLSDLNSQVDYLKRQQKQHATDNSEELKKNTCL